MIKKIIRLGKQRKRMSWLCHLIKETKEGKVKMIWRNVEEQRLQIFTRGWINAQLMKAYWRAEELWKREEEIWSSLKDWKY